MTALRRLFGIETEYALAAFSPGGERLDGDAVGRKMVQLARKKYAALPGMQSSGVFLGNAARLMLDIGSHVEIATPECTTPDEAVRYVLAGDRIVRALADELVAREPTIGAIVLGRGNVDLSGIGAETWASHENQLYRGEPEVLAREIVPHFVSRLVYTGAGGFDNHSTGASFLLSPRVAHLVAERSASSTGSRGIFHQKNESLAGGDYRRLHVLCGESCSSRLATWLKLGTTALVVALIEGGVRPGSAVRLAAPLAAMQAFAADSECRVEAELQDGRRLSAIAIQRHYLAEAEARVGTPLMPEWAGDVCRRWRCVLDELELGPQAVATKLDWAIKLTLFRRHVERRGFAWETMPVWTAVADQLGDAVARSGYRADAITVEEALAHPTHPVPDVVAKIGATLAAHGLVLDGLRAFIDLRQELCEIDTRYGELGDAGLFSKLERAGVLEHDVPGIGDVTPAVERPPARGRARQRGEAIRRLGRLPGCRADWTGVWDKRRRRMLDLRDPFAEDVAWQRWDADGTEVDAEGSVEGPTARLRRLLGGD